MLTSFNVKVIQLVLTIMFYYGSKLNDLIRLKTANYDPIQRLISFKITPDPLLKQFEVYLPLHPPILSLINSMLTCRSSIMIPSSNDTLFCIYDCGYFKPLSLQTIATYLKTLSRKTHEKVDERSIYLSHRYYFTGPGGLNQVIDDIIANRFNNISYIPRIYTQVTLNQVRSAHSIAFKKVVAYLEINDDAIQCNWNSESNIIIGGKRAPGRETLKIIFSYFKDMDLCIAANSIRYLIFLINYCCGSRVGEIISLTATRIDFNLNIIKFRVKDTRKRKNTTKSIPLVGQLKEQLSNYLNLRSHALSILNCNDFPFLLFTVEEGVPKQFTEEQVNNMYAEIALCCGVAHITCHSVRYQTQTDMTALGLDFIYTNCLLSHYPHGDEIFNKTSNVSFVDFKMKYLVTMEKALRYYAD